MCEAKNVSTLTEPWNLVMQWTSAVSVSVRLSVLVGSVDELIQTLTLQQFQEQTYEICGVPYK